MMKRNIVVCIIIIAIVITIISIIKFIQIKKEEEEIKKRTVSTIENIDVNFYESIKGILLKEGLEVEEKEDIYSQELMGKGKRIIVDKNEIEIYQTSKIGLLQSLNRQANTKQIITGNTGRKIQVLILDELTILNCYNTELEKKLTNIFAQK